MHLPLGDQLDYKTNTEVMNARKSYNYENCGVKIYAKEDQRSYRRNFCSCEKKAWKKKFRLSFRFCKSCVYNCDDLLSYKKLILLREKLTLVTLGTKRIKGLVPQYHSNSKIGKEIASYSQRKCRSLNWACQNCSHSNVHQKRSCLETAEGGWCEKD